jgi:hypothetical protein
MIERIVALRPRGRRCRIGLRLGALVIMGCGHGIFTGHRLGRPANRLSAKGLSSRAGGNGDNYIEALHYSVIPIGRCNITGLAR